MQAVFAVAALALGSGAAAAQAAPDIPAATGAGITSWTEAVVSVTDLAASSALLIGPGGWKITGRGMISPTEVAYWRLPGGARGQYLRICAPGAVTGCIRYVQFQNAGPQRPIRLAARPWDTGGIFSIMLRTDSVQGIFDKAIALGWWAESEPYPLVFGGSKLMNVVLTGPHGVNYAFYERQSPSFTAFATHPTSRAFNTMHMVADQPAALAYYRDKLGFGTVFDAPFTDPRAQPTNFSVPPNLATTLVRQSGVVEPVVSEEGRIELMQFRGFTGRDFARFAQPPNLGIISVRYPVKDIAGWKAHLARAGIAPVFQGTAVSIEGIGRIDLLAVRDPDGALTEFYSRP